MRLQKVKTTDKNNFKKIAKSNDISMGLFLTKEIRKIIDSYPEEMKQNVKSVDYSHIQLPSLSLKLEKQFKNIAKNKGLTTSQLLSLHSDSIISSYPEWMIRFEE